MSFSEFNMPRIRSFILSWCSPPSPAEPISPSASGASGASAPISGACASSSSISWSDSATTSNVELFFLGAFDLSVN